MLVKITSPPSTDAMDSTGTRVSMGLTPRIRAAESTDATRESGTIDAKPFRITIVFSTQILIICDRH